MAKTQGKYRIMRWRKKDPVHNLYKAVTDYVRARNGSVVVVGGLEIQQWGESELKYRVAVRCLGKMPTMGDSKAG